ncbi:butyrophilin subfamily 2 member A2-like [Menidia menidia]
MAALRSLSFCLLAVGLLLPAAAFIEQRINITAEAGQDSVTLPCGAGKEKKIRVVRWSRPDLSPDIVLYCRGGQIDSDRQHPSFRNRVDLQDRQMKDGDASLILKNVKINDNGIYVCVVYPGRRYLELISIIHLVVSLPPPAPPPDSSPPPPWAHAAPPPAGVLPLLHLHPPPGVCVPTQSQRK